MKWTASIDTNIIGHLYRSNTTYLITNLFDKILVDEFVLQELSRRCNDIYDDFFVDLFDESTPYILANKSYLKNLSLKNYYDIQIQEMEYLFLPKDEGEKRAIALAQATGTFFLLTDDEKHMDGPYHMINRGLISDMESLGFWDIIFLNAILQKISFDKAKENFESIAKDGYVPIYKDDFKSKMISSLRRLNEKEWFKKEVEDGYFSRKPIKYFINFLKSL